MEKDERDKTQQTEGKLTPNRGITLLRKDGGRIYLRGGLTASDVENNPLLKALRDEHNQVVSSRQQKR